MLNLIRFILSEKRINNIIVEPDVEKYDNTVPVYITYTLINTNIKGNYVYPFNREIYNVEVPAMRGEEIEEDYRYNDWFRFLLRIKKDFFNFK